MFFKPFLINSMKKTLFILATMAVSLATAETSTVLISFGTNSGPSTSIKDGTYLGEVGQKVNRISTDGYNSYTSDVLITTDSNAIGITLTTGSTCCGLEVYLALQTNLPLRDRITSFSMYLALIWLPVIQWVAL